MRQYRKVVNGMKRFMSEKILIFGKVKVGTETF